MAAGLAICALAATQVRASPASTCLRGVNLAGAEFGGYKGEYRKEYIYPSDATLNWAASRNMTAIRLPFRWERLQPALFGGLDKAELKRIQDTVRRANIKGLTVILDVHNYTEYRGEKLSTGRVSSEALADLWRRIARRFKDNGKAVFGLMNEPSGIASNVWFEAAQASIAAIRDEGAGNLVLVPGNIWTGASHWFEAQAGGSNAELFTKLSDPANNFAFEFHQYMDSNFSGTKMECSRTDDALAAIAAVTEWLDENGFKGFLGEFGGTSSPECLTGLMQMAGALNARPGTWIGWTAWAAGDWWGNYPLSLQPVGSIDKPQTKVLEIFWAAKDGTATCSAD